MSHEGSVGHEYESHQGVTTYNQDRRLCFFLPSQLPVERQLISFHRLFYSKLEAYGQLPFDEPSYESILEKDEDQR